MAGVDPVLRRFVKARAAALLHRSAADTTLGRIGWGRQAPVVFGYHRVVEDAAPCGVWASPPMFTSRAMFEQHLDWIARAYRIVSLDELAAALESGEPVPRDVAAITFDDGYQDVYEHAFPVLRRRGLPAALFVVTDVIGTERVLFHDWFHLLTRGLERSRTPLPMLRRALAAADIPVDRANLDRRQPCVTLRTLFARLPQADVARLIDGLRRELAIDPAVLSRFRACTWDMLAEMSGAGIAIGSHTRSHALLTNETPERVRDEVARSRNVIEQRLGRPASYFAYPDGRFNADTVDAVADAGYRLAVTTCRHLDGGRPHLTLPRRLLWQNACVGEHGQFSPAVMSCQVNGVFDLWKPCRHDHGRRGRRP
jgi:peptidoglycan/xylan/chitin deacetylase (PgdA/CDA1 family)